MNLKRTIVLGLAFTAAALTARGTFVVEAAKPQQGVVISNLTIHDDHSLPTGFDPGQPGVYSDGGGQYVDYRAAAGSCVQGDVYAGGLGFLNLNRRISDGVRCSHPTVGGSPRKYTLVIPDSTACGLLGLIDPCVVETTPWESGNNAVVRGETVFKSRATRTDVTLYFRWTDGVDYRITTDFDAIISAGATANDKVVTYGNGLTVSFAKYNYDGNLGYQVQSSFELPFKFTFHKQSLP